MRKKKMTKVKQTKSAKSEKSVKPKKVSKSSTDKNAEVTGTPARPLQLHEILVEGVLVADLMKYNLYLLSKAIIFASVFQHQDFEDAIELTNKAMGELDIVNKKKEEK